MLFSMQQKKFKKLYIYLPRQPLVNDRPWMIAGILFVFIILLFVIYCYLHAVAKEHPKKGKYNLLLQKECLG